MTTVAASWPHFAADTQITGGSLMQRVCKLFRLPDGGVASGSGDWSKAYAALKWLEGGESGDCPGFEGASLLIGRPDGTLWMADDEWPAYPLLGQVASLGCGAQAAMVALSGGQSPEQAVASVAAHDAATSGPVQTMQVCRAVVTYVPFAGKAKRK